MIVRITTTFYTNIQMALPEIKFTKAILLGQESFSSTAGWRAQKK